MSTWISSGLSLKHLKSNKQFINYTYQSLKTWNEILCHTFFTDNNSLWVEQRNGILLHFANSQNRSQKNISTQRCHCGGELRLSVPAKGLFCDESLFPEWRPHIRERRETRTRGASLLFPISRNLSSNQNHKPTWGSDE